MLKYQRWYDQIIDRARDRKLDLYFERHHIIPRALDGTDSPDNLVDLTYREHFLVHWLLTKICTGRDRMLMAHALNAMTMSISGRIVSGWQFDLVKRVFKREYLIRAKARYERRRARLKEKWATDQANALRANETAPGLHPLKDRAQLNTLTADFLKGHPSKRNHRNRRSQNVDIKAKRIIAEANKVLALSPDHGFDIFDPDHVKRKRKRYGRRHTRAAIM